MNYEKVTKLKITDELQSIVDKYDCSLKHAHNYPKDGIHWEVFFNYHYIPFKICYNLDTIHYGIGYKQENQPNKWFIVPKKSYPNYEVLKSYCKNFDKLEDAIKYVYQSSWKVYRDKIEYNMLVLDRIDDWMEEYGIRKGNKNGK